MAHLVPRRRLRRLAGQGEDISAPPSEVRHRPWLRPCDAFWDRWSSLPGEFPCGIIEHASSSLLFGLLKWGYIIPNVFFPLVRWGKDFLQTRTSLGLGFVNPYNMILFWFPSSLGQPNCDQSVLVMMVRSPDLCFGHPYGLWRSHYISAFCMVQHS